MNREIPKRLLIAGIISPDAITSPYAGAVCPRCHIGMNNMQDSRPTPETQRKRYGGNICNNCKDYFEAKELNLPK